MIDIIADTIIICIKEEVKISEGIINSRGDRVFKLLKAGVFS